MRKDKKERLKTIILIALIITSVVQLGIHWNIQTRGLPFNFVSKMFVGNGRPTNLDVESLRNRYFIPESIMVSVSTSHWKIDERDTQFKKIWEDIRDNYLPSISRQKPDKILSKEQWEDIIGERSIRINFDAAWPSNIINWLIGAKPVDAKSFEGIKAIVVAPQLDVNEAVNTVFIYDENQIYQYQVNIKRDFLSKRYYSNLADELSAKNKPSLRLLDSVSNFNSDNDIFVALNDGRGSAFSTISAVIPKEIVVNRANIENYNIQDNILLDKRESLSANYTDTSSYVLFTDTENLYRLYDDCVLEYKYIPAITSGQDNASTAFKNAVTFIEQRRHLVGEANIILKSIKKENNYFLMEFEYKFEGVPIYFAEDVASAISAPITIKANSERILECRWVIRSFTKISKPVNYNLSFPDLLNKQIVSNYPEILDSDDKLFKRIEPGYVFKLNNWESELLAPNWIISTDIKNYFLPLIRKGG